MLPVFIEDGDDAEAQIEASNFKPVWDVLKALRSHDEVLAEHLDQYRTNIAKRSGTTRQTLDDRIIFDLPTTVDPNFSMAHEPTSPHRAPAAMASAPCQH